MKLTTLSDDELLSGLASLVASERQMVVRVIAYLVEIEDRRLELKAACSSLFDFCTRRLGMSEGEGEFSRSTQHLMQIYGPEFQMTTSSLVSD